MERKLTLTLISPRWEQSLWGLGMPKMPPQGLLCLAAMTPDDVELSLVDENIEPLDFEPADVVGITAMTCCANRAYRIADRYRALGSKVVLGGIHPSVLPEEAIQHADSVVIGEADDIWAVILEEYAADRLRPFYKAEAPVIDLPVPRTDLARQEKYAFPPVVQTTRGCPYRCDFCSVSFFNGTRLRHKPVEQVVEEISDQLRESEGPFKRTVLFADDNISGNPKYAASLFEALKPSRINWASHAAINIAKEERLLTLAADSGCKSLFIGFESLNQAALEEINKPPIYQMKEYGDLVKRIHDHGIVVEALFIFGLDADDKDVFKRTTDFCHKNNIQAAQFSILSPFPGTPLYERLKAAGRILTFDWDVYDGIHVVFQPKQMSVEELRQGVAQAYQDFYSEVPEALQDALQGMRNDFRGQVHLLFDQERPAEGVLMPGDPGRR